MQTETGLGVVEIDLSMIDNVRSKLPALDHIRNDIYSVKINENSLLSPKLWKRNFKLCNKIIYFKIFY